MTVAYRDRAVTTGTTADAVGSVPAGAVTGDCLLAFVLHNASGASMTTPATGWTKVLSDPTAGDFSFNMYHRIRQAGDTSSPTWAWSAAGSTATEIVAYSGVDSTSPINASVAENEGAAVANTFDLGPMIPTVSDCMVVLCGSVDAGGSGRTWTVPGTMTERVDVASNQHWHVIADELLSGGADVAVSRSITVAGSAQHFAGYMVALGPAASGVTLDVGSTTHAHTADAVTLTQHHELSVDGTTHGHTAQSPTLAQAHALAVAGTGHGHAADVPALTQTHVLSVDSATHAHAAATTTLAVAGTLDVGPATHGHTTTTVTLTQTHTLAVDDVAHAHTASTVSLAISGALGVDSATHGHTAEPVTLTQHHRLAVDGTVHTHTADTVPVTSGTTLTIGPASHDHAAQAVTLTQAHVLTVDDALHLHTADLTALTQAHALTVADALHGHATSTVTLVDVSGFVDYTATAVGPYTAAYTATLRTAEYASALHTREYAAALRTRTYSSTGPRTLTYASKGPHL